MNAEIERYLAEVRTALPALDLRAVKVRTFGGSKAMADVIVPLIASGEKTGTFACITEADDHSGAAAVGHEPAPKEALQIHDGIGTERAQSAIPTQRSD